MLVSSVFLFELLLLFALVFVCVGCISCGCVLILLASSYIFATLPSSNLTSSSSILQPIS